MSREKLSPGAKHFGIITYRDMYCWNCKKETKWNFILGYVNYHGIIPCLECSECTESIPAFATESYQERGIPIIPV